MGDYHNFVTVHVIFIIKSVEKFLGTFCQSSRG